MLKQPKPIAALCGPASNETMFFQLADPLFEEDLAMTTSSTALISVSGEGSITAEEVEKEVVRMVRVLTPWKWEAIPHGDNAFLIGIPTAADLVRVDGMGLVVRANNVVLSISQSKVDEAKPAFELKPVWVHVSGDRKSTRLNSSHPV